MRHLLSHSCGYYNDYLLQKDYRSHTLILPPPVETVLASFLIVTALSKMERVASIMMPPLTDLVAWFGCQTRVFLFERWARTKNVG
jgi:hypothetical protein